MTLTKSHLIGAITEQNGFTGNQSTNTVETFLELIKSTLASVGGERNGEQSVWVGLMCIKCKYV